MVWMCCSSSSSVSAVVSSWPGERQWTQVLPVSAGRQLHASETSSSSSPLLVLMLVSFHQWTWQKLNFPFGYRLSIGPWLCSSWLSSSTATTQDRYVCVCVWSHPFALQKPKGQINLWCLFEKCFYDQLFILGCGAGSVIVLTPAVASAGPVSVPAISTVTLHHHTCHFLPYFLLSPRSLLSLVLIKHPRMRWDDAMRHMKDQKR